MKKILILTVVVLSLGKVSRAQINSSNASATAQQSVQLALSNALEITFLGNNSATGNTVSLSFTNADHYANGVESAEQELKVRSNKNFKVSAKIDLSGFSYSGTGNIYNAPIPSDAFTLKITNNTTGGNIAPGFTNYQDLTIQDQDILLNGSKGNNQKFSVKYKSNPGWGMPAGTYTFAVVYTATQQ